MYHHVLYISPWLQFRMLSACGLDRRGFRGFTVTRGYCFWIGRRPGLAFRCRLGLVGGVGGDGEIEFPLKGCAYCPLVRGNRDMAASAECLEGSIPAWAGEPLDIGCILCLQVVYPRVGGGTYQTTPEEDCATGLSPRGRGNPYASCPAGTGWRSIPAWAGEPPSFRQPAFRPPVYPRVGGGTRCRLSRHYSTHGLSPRGRGNPALPDSASASSRSIPAWAGEPVLGPVGCLFPSVYPRVGGGTAAPSSRRSPAAGLSPRGRGNPFPVSRNVKA